MTIKSISRRGFTFIELVIFVIIAFGIAAIFFSLIHMINNIDYTQKKYLPPSCIIVKKIDSNTCIIELAGRKYIAVRSSDMFALAPYDDKDNNKQKEISYENPFE